MSVKNEDQKQFILCGMDNNIPYFSLIPRFLLFSLSQYKLKRADHLDVLQNTALVHFIDAILFIRSDEQEVANICLSKTHVLLRERDEF